MADPGFSPILFLDPEGAERNLVTLHETFLRSGSRFKVKEFSGALNDALERSADPDLTLLHFVRFTGTSLGTASLFNDLLQYPLYLELLLKLFGYSQYFADVLIREPELFRWLTASDVLTTPVSASDLQAESMRIFEAFPLAERRLNALRRLHRRELLRIGARDIIGEANLQETARELSVLADCIIDAVLTISTQMLGESCRRLNDIPFAIIGLGKLGGNELNYSSDVDVVFIYGEDRDEESDGTPSAYEMFNKLAERTIGGLTQTTSEGHLYRVDTRLRPESGAGPLARSLSGYLEYYESRGELWERQMLIKARPVAGDREFGRRAIEAFQPFVYPRTFLESPSASAARIKARIEAAVGDVANIKLMAGGIRDIEFIVQSLQLTNGGGQVSVREPNTLRAIEALAAAGLVTPPERRTLADAYVLYRTLEHRLQTMMNTQTHTIPSDGRRLGSLARRLGMESAQELRSKLDRHLAAVRTIFDQVLTGDGTSTLPGVMAIGEGGLDDQALRQLLKRLGFRDPQTASRSVNILVRGRAISGAKEMDTQTGAALRSVLPALFADIRETPDPDTTLASLADVVAGQRLPNAFYGQLADSRFRKFVLNVCALSPRFARGLARHPLVLETLATDPDALTGTSISPPAPGGDLFEYKAHHELRAGIRHLLGFTDLHGLTSDLSGLASHILNAQVHEVRAQGGRSRLPLAVFALGKLGSMELGFDADLDLFFVTGGSGGEDRSTLELAAEDLLRRITAVTPGGKLYDVDVRLRPEGRSAPLTVDAQAYMRYLSTRASLWERQALIRLRFVAGDQTIGAYVASRVSSWVFDSPFPDGWTTEVITMRRKMEARSRVRGGKTIDLKLGIGALLDIEFVAQILQMCHGREVPEIRSARVPAVLRMPSLRGLAPEQGDYLASAHQMYRRIEFLLRAVLDDHGWLLPEGEQLDLLALLYDGSSGAALESRLTSTMKRVRQILLEVAGKVA